MPRRLNQVIARFHNGGARDERGPMWETITAVSLLQSGVDIIRMQHPKAVAAVKKCIDRLY